MGDTKEKKLRVILINRWNLSKSINLRVIAFHQGIKKGTKFLRESYYIYCRDSRSNLNVVNVEYKLLVFNVSYDDKNG